MPVAITITTYLDVVITGFCKTVFINPFYVDVPVLSVLKTLKNRRYGNAFQGVYKWSMFVEWVNSVSLLTASL